MESPTKIIPVELKDGTIIRVEVTSITRDERVSLDKKKFDEFTTIVKSIASDIAETIKEINEKVQPDKTSVKIGLEMSGESGQLTALIVKGAGKANLEISMEWNKKTVI